MTVTTTRDRDGIAVHVNPNLGLGAPLETVAIVGAGRLGFNVKEAYVNREDAVRLIEALTDAVQVHDEAEEAEAARLAAEALKLKAGDKVLGASRRFLFLVITNEDANGLVDLVKLRTGEILRGRRASAFTRRASSGGWVPGPTADTFGPF